MNIRQPTDADWPAIEAFIRRNLGFSHVARRDFNEHWFKPPHRPGWAALMLDDGGEELAGLMMFIVSNVWIAGQTSQMAFISSTAVDPRARHGAGGTLLFLRGFNAFPVIGTMSGNQFSSPINARLGNQVGCGMRRFLRLLDPVIGAICRPDMAGRASELLECQGSLMSASGLDAGWRDQPSEDYDRLWQVFRTRFTITTDRDSEHLRRRYVRAPILTYRFLEVRRQGRLVAHAVARPQWTPAGQFYRVTDFAALPGEEAQGFAATIAAIAGTGAIACDFMVIGTGLDADLKAAGFVPGNMAGFDAVPNLLAPVDHRQWSNDCFLAGDLVRQAEAWKNTDGIYFTKGDGDRDWPTGFDLDRLGLGK